LQSQIAQSTAQSNQVETAIASNSNPGLAPLAAFMTRLYHDARAQVIYAIYMASRSFAFWSLESTYSAFTSYVGLTDPTGITSGSLNTAMQNIINDLHAAIERFASGPQDFPASESQSLAQTAPDGTEDKPKGIAYKLTADDNPGLFATLRTLNSNQLYQVSFTIPPAIKETPKLENPFYDKANVRLAKARPWVYGATTTDDQHILTVDLTHTGAETIVNPDNLTSDFTHEPITKTFQFDYTKTPAYDQSAISLDSGFDDKSEDNLYAQPGPFTTWTLTINPKYNTSLDMSGVNEITLEFWGNSYGFN
jgi:hypothetical protein